MAWADRAGRVQRAVTRTGSGFGRQVTYLPSVGPPVTIDAIWQDKAKELGFDGEMVVSSQAPMIDIKLSDLALPPTSKDRVVVGGVTYSVVVGLEDGEGMISLPLTEVPT